MHTFDRCTGARRIAVSAIAAFVATAPLSARASPVLELIGSNLGTGGFNDDSSGLKASLDKYKLMQFDVTLRF